MQRYFDVKGNGHEDQKLEKKKDIIDVAKSATIWTFPRNSRSGSVCAVDIQVVCRVDDPTNNCLIESTVFVNGCKS